MVNRVAVLLLAMAFLGLVWMGGTAWGATSRTSQGLGVEKGGAIEVSQLVELLAQRGVITV